VEQIKSGIGALSPLALRGINGKVDQQVAATAAAVIAQMLELLTVSTGPNVGPPYEYDLTRRIVIKLGVRARRRYRCHRCRFKSWGRFVEPLRIELR
jgi:transposase-like protein